MRSMECFDVNKFSPTWRGVLLVLGVLVVLGLVVWALWCIPPWQVEQVRVRLDKPADEYRLATLEDEHRRTLVQSIGGFFLLVGLYLAWRRIVATEENVRVAQEGHITEGFTRAIDQLGQEGKGKMAIRLGGIYALERIAKDSEKDHGPIMEVLTAYVREKAPRQEEGIPKGFEKPPPDIQAILTVLGRRETTGKNRGNDPLDLSDTRLVRAGLTDANLSGAILVDADLSGAYLKRANLAGADLTDANLSKAFLNNAKNLTEEQVRSAISCSGATLPDYLPDSVKALTKLPPPV